MTADSRFERRVVRLALVSLVALGVLWLLWHATLQSGALVGWSLAAGWFLMPATLGLSPRWPRVRYAVIVPAAAVGLPLIAICLAPHPGLASAGWLSITAGVLLGGLMGAWFWFRWLPVPAGLHDPFSPGRWFLIVIHVALIACGMLLVATAALLHP